MYIYKRTEAQVWTVGHYDVGDRYKWVSESDHPSRDEAAARVRWLNGGFETAPVAEAVEKVIREAVRAWLIDNGDRLTLIITRTLIRTL